MRIRDKYFPKVLAIREEDYWIIAVDIFVIIFLAAGMWASVPMFRFPPLILGLLGLWFTFVKVRNGYGRTNAWWHVVLTIILSLLLLYAIVALTN